MVFSQETFTKTPFSVRQANNYDVEVNKTSLTLTLIHALLFLAIAGTLFLNSAAAQTFTAITIKADGSIDPPSAPITKAGNVYALTSDMEGSITVEKFDIVLDGAGHSLQGNGTGRGIQIFNPYNATIISSYDVTVKNFNLKGFEEGIDVFGYWGNIISGVIITQNNVAENDVGIRFSSYERYSNNTINGNSITSNNRGVVMEMGHQGIESGNIICQNQIANNDVGMWFLWLGDYYGPKPDPFLMNNRIYDNNFLSNSQNVVNAHVIYDPDCANIWDSESRGNYWSDYSGVDNNGDGIGDTSYVIDENNKDSYPLMAPFESYPTPSPTPTPTPTTTPAPTPTPTSTPTPTPSPEPTPQPEPFSATLAVGSVIAVVAMVGTGLLVHLKKRQRDRCS